MNAVVLANSLAVGAGASLLALATGVTVALAAAVAGRRGRTLWLTAAILNLALPPFLAANAWLDVTALWRATAPAGVVAFGSLPFTMVVLATLSWPLATLVTLSAWSRLSAGLFEADPECRGWRLVRGLLLPAARRELGVVAVVLFALALANFTVPVLFQVRVFTEEFWIRFNTELDAAGAFGAAWPLLVVPGILLVVLRSRTVSWPQPWTEVPGAELRNALGSLAGPVQGMAALWVAVALVFPVGRLVITPRTWTELPGAVRASEAALFHSLGSAVIPATLTVALGLGMSVVRERRAAPRWIWWPFLVPGILLAVGLIQICTRLPLSWAYPGFGVLFLALGLRYLAPGWTLVAESVRQSDPRPAEASRSLGAGPARVFWDAVLPQVLPGAAAAWYGVYLLCLWDVETAVLLQPPGGQTLALRIFNLLHYGHGTQVNALCVVMLALALAPGLVWLLVRRWIRGAGGRTAWMALLAAALLCAGCGRSTDEPESPRAALKSRWFEEARVIGSRGVAPGQFNKPRSLVCDRDDNLYVADLTGRIQKFDPNGRFLLQWQMPVTDLGKPKGMTLDRDGDVVVVEPHYMRVNHFKPDGTRVSQWGMKGTNEGRFILPRSILQNSAGEFFLSEYTVVDRIQSFAPAAKERGRSNAAPAGGFPVVVEDLLVSRWGAPGTRPGEFNRAEGLGLGPDDTVYVADSCNHRIQVFDRRGKFLREHGRAGSNPGEFSYPYDVRVDAAGNQFVCEFGNSRITVLDANDRVVEVMGGAGSEPGRFANPWSIAMDSKGNLYVADSQNHRVQKLVRRPGTLPRPGTSGRTATREGSDARR